MISTSKILEKFSDKEVVASLTEVMAANFEDFSADQSRFRETVSVLANTVNDPVAPSVEDVVDAIDHQIGVCLLFSFFLGLKANLDYFIDPIGHTFLDVDSETYLRESIAKQLPDYQNAQIVLERFYAALSPAQRALYESISAYISHLETVGPKLAHYYGYMFGNQLFSRIILGYDEEMQLTVRYQQMLENFLGVSIM